MVATPTELIIIQQQKKGTALGEECRSFARTHSPSSLLRGLVRGGGSSRGSRGGFVWACVAWAWRHTLCCLRSRALDWLCMCLHLPALFWPGSTLSACLLSGACLLRGTQAPCIAREGLYAAGYLGLCPILYDKLKENPALKVGWGEAPACIHPAVGAAPIPGPACSASAADDALLVMRWGGAAALVACC